MTLVSGEVTLAARQGNANGPGEVGVVALLEPASNSPGRSGMGPAPASDPGGRGLGPRGPPVYVLLHEFVCYLSLNVFVTPLLLVLL